MAINYTSILGLPLIDADHDKPESVAAMKAMSTTLDALFSYFIVDRVSGEIITDRIAGQPVINM